MRVFAFVLAFLSFQAAAQTTAQQIQTTSPQLVVFAGSEANLQSLVNGLALGQTVTLVSQTADGLLQVATFTPPTALGANVSGALEQARTNLISRGIAQPTAQQIAVALMGGTVTTTAGQAQIVGVLTGSTTPANTVQVRNEITGGLVSGATPFGGSAANFQALSTGLRQGTAITLTSPVNGVPQTVTFTAPGGPMSQADANQLLALASQSLAIQGISNPTPAQIQAALVGGTIAVPGGSIALQGVLQGRVNNTSNSGAFGTSNSPTIPGATSASPVTGSTSVSGPTIGSPSVASPVISSPPGVINPSAVSGAGATTPRFGAAGGAR